MQCPLEDPAIGSTSVQSFALDWPELGVGVETQCDALAVEPTNLDGKVELMLQCLHSDSGEYHEVRIRFTDWVAETYLSELPGTPELTVSFYVRLQVKALENPALGQVTIRNSLGELLLLSYEGSWYHQFEEGDSAEVGRASWLQGPAYEAWNEPFGDMTVRHVGCAWRESGVAEGVDVLPLLVEFDADDGPISIYDQNAVYGVQVGGEAFDVLVGTAAVIVSPACEPCPPTRASFIIAPTPG